MSRQVGGGIFPEKDHQKVPPKNRAGRHQGPPKKPHKNRAGSRAGDHKGKIYEENINIAYVIICII